jgi:hypothetical protein
MAVICGADSSVSVTTSIGGKSIIAQATSLFGATPIFWGRYFKDPGSAGGVQYDKTAETPILRTAGILLLAIARQTTRVVGSEQDGRDDAQGNSDAIEAAFGWDNLSKTGNEALVFLDVERSDPVSPEYYLGWSQALMARSLQRSKNKVTLIPCIYAGPTDTTTWTAVAAAIAAGARCDGVWAARYNHLKTGCFPAPKWDAHRLTLPPAITCPVLAWQYDAECHGKGGFDMNIANPNLTDLATLFLDRLITP